MFEKMGIPAAVHVTKHFRPLLLAEAKASGVPKLGVWETPHPVVGKTKDVMRKEVENVFDDIISSFLVKRDTTVVGGDDARKSKIITIEGTDYLDALEKFNRHFLKERWGDGLPLIPPTKEKVEWMLKGTNRAPDEIVVETRPSGRSATIESIAINAVMAGAVPAYLPVIIAALEAWDKSDWGWGSVTTTSPAAPLLVINGPIAKQLDINSKSNAAGYGWKANATIGRALELIFSTVGGTIPGYTDMAIMGSPCTILSTVVAENEDVLDDISWKTYSELKGFSRDANVVSVVPAYWGFEEIWIKVNTAEELLECLIWELNNRGREGLMDWVGGLWLFLCPEHAQILARDGWSKERVKEYLAATLPAYHCYPKGKMKKIFKEAYARATKLVMSMPDDAMISGYSTRPDDYKIFVVGGPGNESQNWRVGAPYDNDFISREIKLPTNWDEVLKESDVMSMPMPKLPW
jgi:hypothetical protein